MIDSAWERLSDMLASWWPGEWTSQKAEAYRLALDGFEPTLVFTALERRLRAGDTFRPSAAEIVAEITGTQRGQRPGPDQAWALVEEAVHMVGCSIYSEHFHDRHQAAIDWLAVQDDVVAAWAARRGLVGRGSLGDEPVHDGAIGGAVLGALRKEYRDHVAQCTERELRGLPAVTDQMLLVRRTGREGGGMRALLDQLQPAPELEAGEPA